MRQSFISFSYIWTWKAEIDYCKQIEMPETKDRGEVGRIWECIRNWIHPFSNLMFSPAHTDTHRYLVSHIKSQLIPGGAIEEIVKMNSHEVQFPFFPHIHRPEFCIYKNIPLITIHFFFISIKHTMKWMAGSLVLPYSDSVTNSRWSFLTLTFLKLSPTFLVFLT